MTEHSTQRAATADLHGTSIVRARIDVIDGPDKGLGIDLPLTAVVVGTGAECDLKLSDPLVSRAHVMLRATSSAIVITDESSRNGTFLGEIRIREIEARSSLSLRIGSTVIALRVDAEAVTVPLSPRMRFGDALGASSAIRHVFAILEQAARHAVTVLIEGDSGTGKDVLARAVHDESDRAGKPFVVVDCGALPENLIESELFGHERGAFTGATGARVGAFELADGGTIFLDEVGELPLILQPKLLRVLETKTFRRIGGSRDVSVDVRVIAATNKRLAQAVRERQFRDDLYYRLAVVHVLVPRLAERSEDIQLIAQAFVEKALGPGSELPPPLVALLASYSWPGNVRELRNVIDRFVAFGHTDPVSLFGADAAASSAAKLVDTRTLDGLGYHDAKARLVEAFHKDFLGRALERHGGSMSQAAATLGIPRTSLYRMLDRDDRDDE
jgi:transcriptional regulator with PAS, ATPase and Fis domain